MDSTKQVIHTDVIKTLSITGDATDPRSTQPNLVLKAEGNPVPKTTERSPETKGNTSAPSSNSIGAGLSTLGLARSRWAHSLRIKDGSCLASRSTVIRERTQVFTENSGGFCDLRVTLQVVIPETLGML